MGIVINPNIHFGKPCVAGTRIPVHNVLELVSEGVAFVDIVRDYYPDLKLDDIRACVRYAMMTYTVDQLAGAFVVVEPGRHRFRRLPGR